MMGCARGRGFLVALLLIAIGVGCSGQGASKGRTGHPLPSPSPSSAPTKALYVSPSGSGSSCTSGQPCSLLSAVALVETMNQNMQSDITVYLADGTYELAQPLQLGRADSGFNGYYVNYVAASTVSPVISGGTLIQGWQLSDPTLGIYQATVPPGFDTRQLYVNGTRVQRASTTNIGSSLISNGFQLTINGNAPAMDQWRNLSRVEVVMSSWWRMFRCPVASVVASGSQSFQVAVQNPCWNNTTPGQPFGAASVSWIENAYELLRQPGQWYLDETQSVVYYIPKPGEDLASGVTKVVAGRLQQIVTAQGTSNIRFLGLTFAYSTWLEPNTSVGFAEDQAGFHVIDNNGNEEGIPGALNFSGATNVIFQGNQFLHLGGGGLNVSGGSQNITIQGNTFSDISGNGIVLGDITDRSQTNTVLENSSFTVANNYVTQIGVEYEGTVGIFGGYLKGVTLSQNEIANLGYTGISIGWGWASDATISGGEPTYAANTVITGNWVHDVMQTLIDGGGVYTLSAQPGSSITGNLIEGIGPLSSCPGPSYPGYQGYVGIYHDNGSMYFHDTQNVVRSNCGYWLLLQDGWASGQDTYDTLLDSNYVDADIAECGPATVASSDPKCQTNGNSVTNTIAFGKSPPPAAQAIIDAAGILPSFARAKNVRSGALYR